MDVQGFIPATDAAGRLGITDARVRALLRSGGLRGAKVAGRWLVAEESLYERDRSAPIQGRQLHPANAWAALAASSAAPAPWVTPLDLRRVMELLDARGLRGLAPRLRHRAQPRSFYAHPGVLRELAGAEELALTGVSAARATGLDLVGGGELDAYVAAERLEQITERFVLQPRDVGGNVVLRVLPTDVSFISNEPVPRAAVALDLAEGVEPRGREIGAAELRRIDQEQPWRRGE